MNSPRPRPNPTPLDELPTGADIRLVVADMDGTLLSPDGTVPEDTWRLIELMRQRSIVFAPASGRQYATLRELFERVADGMVFIAENGSLVVRDGQHLDSTPLESAIVSEVVRRVRDLAEHGANVGAVVCTAATAYVERSDQTFLAECGHYYKTLQVVDDLDRISDTVIKVAVYDFADIEDRTAPVLKQLADRARVVVSGQHWTDVQAMDADKGVALAHLQQSLGVDRNQTVVFGDYLNDVGLFDHSELSFAMANAHPEVIDVAAYIAPSNADNGVAHVLGALLDT